MKSILCLVSAIIILGCYSAEPEKTKHKGENMPDFTIFLADSSTYFKSTDLRNNKASVLFYFGPHCPYSLAQMESIVDNIESLKNIELLIFTTSSFNEMKWFYTKYKLHKYSNIKTGIDYNNFFINYFEVVGVPFIAIYNRERKLVEAFSGQTPIRQIKSVLQRSI